MEFSVITPSGYGPADSTGVEKSYSAVVEKCVKWIGENLVPAKTYSKKTSYHYKHLVETETGEYVPNGAFIAAARLAGYEDKRVDKLNAVFKFKKKQMLKH